MHYLGYSMSETWIIHYSVFIIKLNLAPYFFVSMCIHSSICTKITIPLRIGNAIERESVQPHGSNLMYEINI